MSLPTRRWMLWTLAAAFAVVVTLAACGVSSVGGVLGALLTGLFVGGLLLGGALTQSGCDGSRAVQTDGSPADTRVGPCLSQDAYIGPCLGALPADGGVHPCLSQDAYIGPCLDPLPPDAEVGPCLKQALDAGADVYIGPCLDTVPPDAGVTPCLFAADSHVGPCLGMPYPDGDFSDGPRAQLQSPPAPPSLEAARRDVLERLSSVLPEDVLQRLTTTTTKRRG